MSEVGGIAIIADSQGAGEFTAHPDALRFIIAVRDAGIHLAATSSAKNAGLFLRKIRLDTSAGENGLESERVKPGLPLLEFFGADISRPRLRAEEPHPEIFLTAAKELGVPPEECFVVEDAVWHPAGKAGGMTALGLSRWRRGAPLRRRAGCPGSPPWTVSTLTRWPKAAWRRWTPNFTNLTNH